MPGTVNAVGLALSIYKILYFHSVRTLKDGAFSSYVMLYNVKLGQSGKVLMNSLLCKNTEKTLFDQIIRMTLSKTTLRCSIYMIKRATDMLRNTEQRETPL